MRVSCCFIVAAIVGQAEIISRIDNNQSSKRGPSNWSVAAPTTLKSTLINEVTTKWRQKKMFSNNATAVNQFFLNLAKFLLSIIPVLWFRKHSSIISKIK